MDKIKTSSNFLLGSLKKVDDNQCNLALPRASDNRAILCLVDNSGDFLTDKGNKAVAKRWDKVKNEYRLWWRGQVNFKLGEYIYTQVQSDTSVYYLLVKENAKLNMEAFKKAIEKLSKEFSQSKLNVHIQAQEEDLEEILVDFLVKKGVNVYIYP